jgi:hypothetical protein
MPQGSARAHNQRPGCNMPFDRGLEGGASEMSSGMARSGMPTLIH